MGTKLITVLHSSVKFMFACIWGAGNYVYHKPINLPSGKYDESLRVERPQHDLVTDMELELSRLPRYEAYAKIIDDIQDKQIVCPHRMQTHPLPEITNPDMVDHAIANGHTLGKKREEIEAAIRQRQNRWRGGSGPSTRRRRE